MLQSSGHNRQQAAAIDTYCTTVGGNGGLCVVDWLAGGGMLLRAFCLCDDVWNTGTHCITTKSDRNLPFGATPTMDHDFAPSPRPHNDRPAFA